MHALEARVENGRYVIDEAAQLPDGSVVQLQVIDGDELDPDERKQLHAALEAGLDDSEADRVISAEESLTELRALRCGSK